LLEQHCHNLLTSLLEQHCHNLLTSLLQTCCEKSCWQVVGNALSQLVNKLATSLLGRHTLLTSCWNSIFWTC
jgi:hypothetical protein